ncbi:site-2 protease family protein [bacterium]|nr:site-2 protease family protein [bacterium]
MNERGITLFRLFGFRVKIDLSWLILGFLVTWTLAKGYFPNQYDNLSLSTYWIMGAFGAVGLFFSIVFHEFCHSYIARKRGMPMKGITLFIFGGIAEMDEQPQDPKTELLMAVAGPVSSIVLGLLFFGIYYGLGRSLPSSAVSGVIRYLGMINLILAGFNLLPAFPLDGGRIFRAALWAWKKDIRQATRIAYRIGNGFGWFLIFLGFLNALGGNLVSGIWWIMIGFFLRSASQMSYKQVILRKSLEGEKVRDFMNDEPVTVNPDTTVDDLIHQIVYKYHHKMYPVVENGELLGCVHLKQIKQIPENERKNANIQSIVEMCHENNTIGPDDDAMQGLHKMKKNSLSRLMVTRNGKLVGIIALRDIMNVLSLKMDFDLS